MTRFHSSPIHFDLYTATLSEYDADGFLGVQPDWYGEEESGGPAAEVFYPTGFFGRPCDPDSNGLGCTVLVGEEGGRRHVLPLTDPRAIPNLPTLKKGESIQFAYNGTHALGFRRCHDDGSLSEMTTEDATPNGRSVTRRTAPDGFTEDAPWGRQRFDPTGWHILTHFGASLHLGGVNADLPAPLDQLTSFAKLQAHMISLEGSIVRIGPRMPPGPTFDQPIAKATSLLAYLTALEVALEAFATGLNAAPGGSAAQSALTAAIAAMQGTKALIVASTQVT